MLAFQMADLYSCPEYIEFNYEVYYIYMCSLIAFTPCLSSFRPILTTDTATTGWLRQ